MQTHNLHWHVIWIGGNGVRGLGVGEGRGRKMCSIVNQQLGRHDLTFRAVLQHRCSFK